jgi:hypothetical protein
MARTITPVTNPNLERLRKLGPRLKGWIVNDWEAKLVSLVLAFLLWYVVNDQARADKRPIQQGLPSFRTD